MTASIEVPCQECGQKFLQLLTAHRTAGDGNGITTVSLTATDTEGELYDHMVTEHGR